MSGASAEPEQGSRLFFGAKTAAKRPAVDARTSRDPVVAGAWSARRTLCFIMLTCGAFWAAALALLLR
jgi:hypothetical protein